jgi:hypothetical protein
LSNRVVRIQSQIRQRSHIRNYDLRIRIREASNLPIRIRKAINLRIFRLPEPAPQHWFLGSDLGGARALNSLYIKICFYIFYFWPGATVCTPKSPSCGSCPLKDICQVFIINFIVHSVQNFTFLFFSAFRIGKNGERAKGWPSTAVNMLILKLFSKPVFAKFDVFHEKKFSRLLLFYFCRSEAYGESEHLIA